MNLVALTIPDLPDELAPWLERQLLSPDLSRLAAELAAVHGRAEPPGSVGDLLGNHLDAVMQRGLSVLPRPVLKDLLRHPGYLLDLQELVLIDGSEHWTRQLGEPTASPITAASPAPKRDSFFRRPWVVAVLTTAAVSALFLLLDPARWGGQGVTPDVTAASGWNKPDAFSNEPTASAYLRRVAADAEEYQSTGPESPEALATRIGEFRNGCTRLLLASHSSLLDANRDDLRKRCRKWADKLDQQRLALENDPSKAAAISSEVDQLIRTLATTLRKQADELQVS